MTEKTVLGPGPEFDLIRTMLRALGPNGRFIGDDASVLDVPAGHKLVVSTDTSVENIHFRRDWLTFEEIGFRATAAALSDLAAMGAMPLGVLLAIALPDADSAALHALATGAGSAASQSRTFIIGGDLSSSATLTITATVLGSAFRPLPRSGARIGDCVYLTGTLGGSGLGLAALQRGETPPVNARRKFAVPQPRILEAAWLAEQGVNSCIDISDGMAGDLGHIAAASAVGLVVDVGRIPLFPGATVETALSSGEEYELCVTASGEIDTVGFEKRFGLPLSLIGSVEESASPSVIFKNSGAPIGAPGSFSHFSR